MARRGSGLASNPLAHLQDDETAEQAIVQAAQAAGRADQDLPIRAVAPDPENPKSRLTPARELVASIKVEGQVAPGVVVPLDVWVGYGNDPEALYTARAEAEGADAEADPAKYAEAKDKAKAEIQYVINYGHRRWAAATAAGVPTYRAIVSDTLKDNTTKRVHRLIENVQREDLTPLEEAQEYQRLMELDKLSQREISRRTGIPQPHISKRISLLNLPLQAQEALSKGTIPVEAAVDLAKIAKEADRVKRVIDAVNAMPAGDEPERNNRARTAVDLARKEYNAFKAAKDKADKRKKLAAEGIVLIDNVTTYFADKPAGRWAHELRDDDWIAAAREAGTLAAYVADADHIEYYLTELPPPPEPAAPEAAGDEQDADADADTDPDAGTDAAGVDGEPAPSGATPALTVVRTSVPAPRATAEPEETPEQRERREAREREQREHEAAANARAAACARIAAKAPNREALTARLARRVLLVEEDHSYEAQELAVKWLKAASVIDDATTVYTLFGYDTNIDTKLAARAAWVYDLALSEIRAVESSSYDSEDEQHIRRLIEEAGYEPAEWEQQALLSAANES